MAIGATLPGNSGASISATGSNHNVKAAPAPKTRRAGRRSTNTTASPSVTPSSIRNRSSVTAALLLFELVDELAKFGNVLRAQLLVAAEVHQQRRDAAAEHAVQQAAAFRCLPLLAGQERRIQVTTPLAFGAHGSLADEAVQQRPDGVFVPGGTWLQRRHQFFRALRRVLPQQLHYLTFGFADRGWRRFGHGRSSTYKCS